MKNVGGSAGFFVKKFRRKWSSSSIDEKTSIDGSETTDRDHSLSNRNERGGQHVHALIKHDVFRDVLRYRREEEEFLSEIEAIREGLEHKSRATCESVASSKSMDVPSIRFTTIDGTEQPVSTATALDECSSAQSDLLGINNGAVPGSFCHLMNYVVHLRRDNRHLNKQVACLTEMRNIEQLKNDLLSASCCCCKGKPLVPAPPPDDPLAKTPPHVIPNTDQHPRTQQPHPTTTKDIAADGSVKKNKTPETADKNHRHPTELAKVEEKRRPPTELSPPADSRVGASAAARTTGVGKSVPTAATDRQHRSLLPTTVGKRATTGLPLPLSAGRRSLLRGTTADSSGHSVAFAKKEPNKTMDEESNNGQPLSMAGIGNDCGDAKTPTRPNSLIPTRRNHASAINNAPLRNNTAAQQQSPIKRGARESLATPLTNNSNRKAVIIGNCMTMSTESTSDCIAPPLPPRRNRPSRQQMTCLIGKTLPENKTASDSDEQPVFSEVSLPNYENRNGGDERSRRGGPLRRSMVNRSTTEPSPMEAYTAISLPASSPQRAHDDAVPFSSPPSAAANERTVSRSSFLERIGIRKRSSPSVADAQSLLNRSITGSELSHQMVASTDSRASSQLSTSATRRAFVKKRKRKISESDSLASSEAAGAANKPCRTMELPIPVQDEAVPGKEWEKRSKRGSQNSVISWFKKPKKAKTPKNHETNRRCIAEREQHGRKDNSVYVDSSEISTRRSSGSGRAASESNIRDLESEIRASKLSPSRDKGLTAVDGDSKRSSSSSKVFRSVINVTQGGSSSGSPTIAAVTNSGTTTKSYVDCPSVTDTGSVAASFLTMSQDSVVPPLDHHQHEPHEEELIGCLVNLQERNSSLIKQLKQKSTEYEHITGQLAGLEREVKALKGRYRLDECLESLSLKHASQLKLVPVSMLSDLELRLGDLDEVVRAVKGNTYKSQQDALDAFHKEQSVSQKSLDQVEMLQKSNFELLQRQMSDLSVFDGEARRKLDALPSYESLYSFTMNLIRKLKQGRAHLLQRSAAVTRLDIELLQTQSSLLLAHAQIERQKLEMNTCKNYQLPHRPFSYHGEDLFGRLVKPKLSFYLPFKLHGTLIAKKKEELNNRQESTQSLHEDNHESEFMRLFEYARRLSESSYVDLPVRDYGLAPQLQRPQRDTRTAIGSLSPTPSPIAPRKRDPPTSSSQTRPSPMKVDSPVMQRRQPPSYNAAINNANRAVITAAGERPLLSSLVALRERLQQGMDGRSHEWASADASSSPITSPAISRVPRGKSVSTGGGGGGARPLSLIERSRPLFEPPLYDHRKVGTRPIHTSTDSTDVRKIAEEIVKSGAFPRNVHRSILSSPSYIRKLPDEPLRLGNAGQVKTLVASFNDVNSAPGTPISARSPPPPPPLLPSPRPPEGTEQTSGSFVQQLLDRSDRRRIDGRAADRNYDVPPNYSENYPPYRNVDLPQQPRRLPPNNSGDAARRLQQQLNARLMARGDRCKGDDTSSAAHNPHGECQLQTRANNTTRQATDTHYESLTMMSLSPHLAANRPPQTSNGGGSIGTASYSSSSDRRSTQNKESRTQVYDQEMASTRHRAGGLAAAYNHPSSNNSAIPQPATYRSRPVTATDPIVIERKMDQSDKKQNSKRSSWISKLTKSTRK